MPRKGGNYHHGDLREALIDAAWGLIIASGADGFALADAARQAGVSTAAPYRHFKDRDALLQAVRERAFDQLSDLASELSQKEALGTRERILCSGIAYLRFVRTYPALFPVMWSTPYAADADFDSEETHRGDGFYNLRDNVEAWCQQEALESQAATAIAIKLWAMVHGMASLELNRHLHIFMPDVDVEEMLQSMAHEFLDGVQRG